MAFTSQYFIINGINSSDIGVDGIYLVRTDSEINRQLIGAKDIVEDVVAYNDKPYFYKTKKNPIQFSLKFSLLENNFDQDRLFELGKIFAQDRYVCFTSCDYIGLEFWVICTSINIITHGNYKGWIEVSMRNAYPYALSTKQSSDIYNFSNLTSPETFEVNAKFNVMHPLYQEYIYFPQLNIDMKGSATSITLSNLSYGGKQFGFTGLTSGESLEIFNDRKKIVSSTGNPRISNLINQHYWFRLIQGKNIISVNSPSVIQIISQYPVYI